MKIARGEFTKKLYIQNKSSWCSRGKLGFPISHQACSSAIPSALTAMGCLSDQWKIHKLHLDYRSLDGWWKLQKSREGRELLRPPWKPGDIKKEVSQELNSQWLPVLSSTGQHSLQRMRGQQRGTDAPGRGSAGQPLRLPLEFGFRGSPAVPWG